MKSRTHSSLASAPRALRAQAPNVPCHSCGRRSPGAACPTCARKRAHLARSGLGRVALDDGRREQVLSVLRSPGMPLDPATRPAVEGWFARDFSRVRVHTDSRAATSAAQLNASAYTVGHHIVFADGHYAPKTLAGRKLLAHELTHVVQQERASGAEVGDLAVATPNDPCEREAERTAGAFIAAGVVRPGTAAVGTPPKGEHEAFTALPTQLLQRDACGPDVTEQIKSTWQRVQTDFWRWSGKDKANACDYLLQARVPIDPDDHSLAPPSRWNTDAFDTLPLFHIAARGWLLDDAVVAAGCGVPTSTDKTNASAYENPDLCSMSVQVNDQCWLSGTVNYGTYGVMCRLCKDWDLDYFEIYYKATALLYAYKARIFARSATTKEDDISVPHSWFKATYEGGPGATPSIAGNRSKKCPCTCRLTGSMVRWDYVWEPTKRRVRSTPPGAPNVAASGTSSPATTPATGPDRRGFSGDHEPSGPREA